MVFQNGNVDEDVALHDQFVDPGFLEGPGSPDRLLAVGIALVGGYDRSSCARSRFLDAASCVAALPEVAGMVENVDFGGPRLEAPLDDPCNQSRVGVRPEGLFDVPGDVGFHEDRLPFRDETPDAAQGRDSTIEHFRRFAACYRRQVYRAGRGSSQVFPQVPGESQGPRADCKSEASFQEFPAIHGQSSFEPHNGNGRKVQ